MNATSVIYRYEIPVDDQWHEFMISSDVLHVASRHYGTVEFWALHNPECSVPRRFIVVATGQPTPEGSRYIGTALSEHNLVWHLFGQDE